MKRWMCVQCTWRWFHVSLSLALYIVRLLRPTLHLLYYLYLWYVWNNWCRTNPKLVLHTHKHITKHLHPRQLTRFFHTLHFVCWFLFYRSRQAHKLSNLNWIPFILMFHYQTIRFDAIEQIVKQEKEPKERNEKKTSPNILCVFSHFIIMCLHSLHFARHQMNKHNDWDARVPFLRC